MVASRKLESCEQVAGEIASETGRRALPVACHVGEWDSVDRLVETVYAELGRVDVLVNNAGGSPPYPDLLSVSETLWDKTVAVNLKGPFRLAALVGSRMAEADGGSIVNITSAAAEWPAPDMVVYAAAKAGLNNLTIGLARALGPTVRVNAVQPGAFLTSITEGWDPEVFGRRQRGYALQRGGQPDEIVGAVLYLASDAASFTTGAVLRVDGGYNWSPD